jgi:tRNA G18 (ribose-2'-O)-methylase SpoU
MGTAFTLPHARTLDLVDLLDGLDIDLLALTPDPNADPINAVAEQLDRQRPRAILIGSERAGLSDELLGLAQGVRIPMADGVDSLNAAAASAVACHVLR